MFAGAFPGRLASGGGGRSSAWEAPGRGPCWPRSGRSLGPLSTRRSTPAAVSAWPGRPGGTRGPPRSWPLASVPVSDDCSERVRCRLGVESDHLPQGDSPDCAGEKQAGNGGVRSKSARARTQTLWLPGSSLHEGWPQGLPLRGSQPWGRAEAVQTPHSGLRGTCSPPGPLLRAWAAKRGRWGPRCRLELLGRDTGGPEPLGWPGWGWTVGSLEPARPPSVREGASLGRREWEGLPRPGGLGPPWKAVGSSVCEATLG